MVMGLGLKYFNMVTIYTITYNEELILPFFINHYRKLFPNCHIVIYDNESTDNTVIISKEFGCEVISYNTNNTINDKKYLEIKNNCWKTSKTNWNIVCDSDELCLITLDELIEEDKLGTSIIQFSAYDMINTSNDTSNIEIKELKYGVKNTSYDKKMLFNKNKINEINYLPGCHQSNPIGVTQYSKQDYKMLHYKYIGEDFLVKRYNIFKGRLSEENLRFGWGFHYSDEEKNIRNYFNELKNKSIKII